MGGGIITIHLDGILGAQGHSIGIRDIRAKTDLDNQTYLRKKDLRVFLYLGSDMDLG